MHQTQRKVLLPQLVSVTRCRELLRGINGGHCIHGVHYVNGIHCVSKLLSTLQMPRQCIRKQLKKPVGAEVRWGPWQRVLALSCLKACRFPAPVDPRILFLFGVAKRVCLSTTSIVRPLAFSLRISRSGYHFPALVRIHLLTVVLRLHLDRVIQKIACRSPTHCSLLHL